MNDDNFYAFLADNNAVVPLPPSMNDAATNTTADATRRPDQETIHKIIAIDDKKQSMRNTGVSWRKWSHSCSKLSRGQFDAILDKMKQTCQVMRDGRVTW